METVSQSSRLNALYELETRTFADIIEQEFLPAKIMFHFVYDDFLHA